MEIKRTEVTKHYWDNEGVYDKEFNELTNALMEPVGRGENLRAEVVRAANRLYYEYCNNGNCNAVHVEYGDEVEVDCPCCGGSGYLGYDEDEICNNCVGLGVVYEEGENEYSVSEYYDNFIKLIIDSLNDRESFKAMENIRSFIEQTGDGAPHDWYFNDNNMHMYDLMIDLVYEWAVKHENDNTPIPNWYKND